MDDIVGLIEETKVLKQLVRDIIQPERDLGHSDKKGHKSKGEELGNINGSGEDEVPKETAPEANVTAEFLKTVSQACEDCQ
jgi:hypothetical protein